MSRGWEVKSVQGMMDDHDNRPKRREPERTPEQMAYEKKRYGLELSRTGVRNDGDVEMDRPFACAHMDLKTLKFIPRGRYLSPMYRSRSRIRLYLRKRSSYPNIRWIVGWIGRDRGVESRG